MRKNVRALVELLARDLPLGGPVVEVGSYCVPGQEEIADFRDLFRDVPYLGLDARPGPGVDLVADGVQLPIPDGSAGTVLVLETVEHARDPVGIAREAHRICGAPGVMVLTTCLDFRIHHHPDDYWRFTPSAIEMLIEPFPTRLVGFHGHPKFPHSVFGVGINLPADEAAKLVTDQKLAGWQRELQETAAFPRPWSEKFRVALGSLVHSRALRSYRELNHFEFSRAR